MFLFFFSKGQKGESGRFGTPGQKVKKKIQKQQKLHTLLLQRIHSHVKRVALQNVFSLLHALRSVIQSTYKGIDSLTLPLPTGMNHNAVFASNPLVSAAFVVWACLWCWMTAAAAYVAFPVRQQKHSLEVMAPVDPSLTSDKLRDQMPSFVLALATCLMGVGTGCPLWSQNCTLNLACASGRGSCQQPSTQFFPAFVP